MNSANSIYCKECDKMIRSSKFESHVHKRKKSVVGRKGYYIDEDTKLLLHDIQASALGWCSKKARIFNKSVIDNARIRFITLGYSEEDFMQTHNYLLNVDPIVHFGKSNIRWLITDDRLRNLFEIVNGNCGARVDWENILFGNIYTDACPFNLRVKYGCLNLMSEPRGCASARLYGLSYMVLKPEVKKRITFVVGDSSSKEQHMCTFSDCSQLFMYVQDQVVHDMVKVAKGININNGAINPYGYIEIQIHGDVIFTRDVERIMIHQTHANTYPDVLLELERQQIPYVVFQ